MAAILSRPQCLWYFGVWWIWLQMQISEKSKACCDMCTTLDHDWVVFIKLIEILWRQWMDINFNRDSEKKEHMKAKHPHPTEWKHFAGVVAIWFYGWKTGPVTGLWYSCIILAVPSICVRIGESYVRIKGYCHYRRISRIVETCLFQANFNCPSLHRCARINNSKEHDTQVRNADCSIV